MENSILLLDGILTLQTSARIAMSVGVDEV